MDEKITSSEIFINNIVSVVISALIIRSLHVFIDCLKIAAEEAVDDKSKTRWRRSKYYFANAILVSSICGFLGILIYEQYTTI